MEPSLPPLKLLHSGATLETSSSYAFWSRQDAAFIISSLRPDGPLPLTVKDDGTIMNGNTRIYILKQRGIPVDHLPRRHYE
jgi:hypothetical protein